MQNNSPMANLQLPMIAGYFSDEHLRSLVLPENQRKYELDMNYMRILLRDNPEVQAADIVNFIHKCQITGADPRIGQVHLVSFKSKMKVYDPVANKQVDQWVTKANTIYSYHFFISKSRETGELDDIKVHTEIGKYWNPGNGVVIDTICAIATVVRKGQSYTYRAWFPEFVKQKDVYDNGVKTGQQIPTEAWLSKPYLMLEKCAIANALRIMFSEALNGMYISEEMVGEFSKVPEVKDVGPVAPLAPVTPVSHEVSFKAAPQAPQEQAPQDPPPVDTNEPIDASYTVDGQKVPEPPPVERKTVQEMVDDSPMGPATKGRVWAGIQAFARRGMLDDKAAVAKLGKVKQTEGLGKKLIADFEAGDLSWFTEQA